MKLAVFALVTAALTFSNPSFAKETEIEELNPFEPGIEQFLEEFDAIYEQETGLPSHYGSDSDSWMSSSCYRASCRVWVDVHKSEQKLYLYLNGRLSNSWLVSTGTSGHGTPNFDKHPDGRIYNRYTSTKFPGGDYKGLGNMPYAVFIRGGFALHGTPKGNWSKLGRRASHGCIRQHPDNARVLNQLVRSVGIRNVWITVR